MNDTQTLSFTLTKEIACSIEEAFDAFTTEEKLSKWFSDRVEIDLRVGGKYDTSDDDVGTYLLVDRPTQVTFTWDNADHCPGTEVDIHFGSAGDGVTLIELTHSKLQSQAGLEDMMEGWSWALDCVALFLESGTTIGFKEWQARQDEN